MKPFDLNQALAGAIVVTRDSREVKIAGYNPEAEPAYQILGWLCGRLCSWSKFGNYNGGIESNRDLFMAPTERKEWIVRCPEYKVIGPFHNSDLAEQWKLQMNRPDATIHEITVIE